MSNFKPKKDDIAVLKSNEIYLLLENTYKDDINITLYVFHIYLKGRYNKIGRITLRLGTNEEIYYFGNIGYNISKKYRGNHFAAKACLMLKELLKKYNVKDSLILTVNPNNIASHKTCKYIGATLIETVQVKANNKLYKHGNHIKCRYILNIL